MRIFEITLTAYHAGSIYYVLAENPEVAMRRLFEVKRDYGFNFGSITSVRALAKRSYFVLPEDAYEPA